ncbi:hypothetical protein DV735_g3712, partial [Chaetothyriales sp. CBS 134920]
MAADPVTASTVDDLLDYNFSDLEDPFSEKPNNPKTRSPSSAAAAKRKLDEDKKNLSLGIDEEVKVVKKRQPIAKLDEARLLSERGIPRIRRLARSGKIAKSLRFKGKGHEFSDVARLLNYYQLWLDGLYPRAKFADGLQMIEKVGHSKRMNVVRKTWIDEGKPGYQPFEESNSVDQLAPASQPAAHDVDGSDAAVDQAPTDSLFFQDPTSNHEPDTGVPSEDDDLEALLAENARHPADPVERPRRTEMDELDDLDALIAEQSGLKQKQNTDHDDDDDLDALIAEQESRNPPASGLTQKQSEGDGDDDDDLDALLAEQESRNMPAPVLTQRQGEDADDDLDALLAQYEA